MIQKLALKARSRMLVRKTVDKVAREKVGVLQMLYPGERMGWTTKQARDMADRAAEAARRDGGRGCPKLEVPVKTPASSPSLCL